MTVDRLVTLLQAISISISKRQVMRLLIDQQDDFLTGTRAVLRAGLQRPTGSRWTTPVRATAPWPHGDLDGSGLMRKARQLLWVLLSCG
ncbi:MAG: hypothetical protein WB902_33380 [Acetobacteraceae bacterium]